MPDSNPLSFDGWTYTWQVGRQLAGMSKTGATLSFKYDHNGLRTQKVVQTNWLPETTNYYLHGKLLTHMTVDYTDFDEVAHQDKLHFFYDAQSRPAQVKFNGVIYTYVHNLQGDIVGLLDSTGALAVEYRYDAWGKPISTTGSLADTLGKRNPFRYRGYVYDEETGLYYLRSRYYNPTVGRFVNADGLLGSVGILCAHNLYTYCGCKPIVNSDPDGTFAIGLGLGVGALISTLAGLYIGTQVATNSPSVPTSRSSRAKQNSIPIGTVTRSLLDAKTVNATTKSKEIFNYNYYFALVVGSKVYEYVMVIDYAMDLKTAAFVVQSATIMDAVLNRFGLEYDRNATNVSYGIYTPTWYAAERLASVTFGSGATETHSAYGTKYPGEYYMHYHSQGHSIHIWFGQPTIFPYIE